MHYVVLKVARSTILLVTMHRTKSREICNILVIGVHHIVLKVAEAALALSPISRRLKWRWRP